MSERVGIEERPYKFSLWYSQAKKLNKGLSTNEMASSRILLVKSFLDL